MIRNSSSPDLAPNHMILLCAYKCGEIRVKHIKKAKRKLGFLSGEDEIRTRGRIVSYVGLANRWFQPLTHLSKFGRKDEDDEINLHFDFDTAKVVILFLVCKFQSIFFLIFSKPNHIKLTCIRYKKIRAAVCGRLRPGR